MSQDAREWVWTQSRSRGTARLILLDLADHVTGPDCVAYGSTASFAQRAYASRRAVIDAVDRLLDSPELEIVAGRRGPRGATVYRLPQAAEWVQKLHPLPDSGGADSAPPEDMGGCGNCTPGGAETAPGGCGICTRGGADSAPQNRERTEKGTERGTESPGAAPSASPALCSLSPDWRPSSDLIGWAIEAGHMQRLGPDGLDHATAKWVTVRTAGPPRTAAQWAADWQQWVTRERPAPPSSSAPPLHPPGTGFGTPRTRSEQYEAALAAALAAMTEQEAPTP